MDIAEIKSRMRRAGEKATPGEWRHQSMATAMFQERVMAGEDRIVTPDVFKNEDAAYIAAASPERTRALIEDHDRLEQLAAALDRFWDGFMPKVNVSSLDSEAIQAWNELDVLVQRRRGG